MEFFNCPKCGRQVAETWERGSTVFMLITNKSCSNCDAKVGLDIKLLFTLYIIGFVLLNLISLCAAFFHSLLKAIVPIPYSGILIIIIIWGALIFLLNYILPYAAGNLLQKRIFITKQVDL